MNYQRHYDLLIERAKTRILSGYVEVHHVLPSCMGGSDGKENLVQLTAEKFALAGPLRCMDSVRERPQDVKYNGGLPHHLYENVRRRLAQLGEISWQDL